MKQVVFGGEISMSVWTRSSWTVKLALGQMGLKFGREFWARTDIWEASEFRWCFKPED